MKNSLCVSFLLLMLSVGIQGCFENRQPEDTPVNYIKKPLYIELINFKDTSVFLVKYTSPVVYFYNGLYYYQDENNWKKTKFIGRPDWTDEPNVPQAIKTVSTISEPNGEQFLRRIGYRQVAIHEPEDYSEVFIYSYWDFNDVYYHYNPDYRSYRRIVHLNRNRRHHRDDSLESSTHSGQRRHHAHRRPGHHRPAAGEAGHHRNRPHRPVPMVTSSSHGRRHPSAGVSARRHRVSSGSNSPGSSHSGYSGRSSRPSRSRDYSSSSGRSYSSRPSYSGSSSSSSPSYSGSSSSSSRGSSSRFRIR